MPDASTTVIELLVATGAYAVVLVVVVYLTRARRRRVAGALAGGVSAAAVGLAATTVAELNDWWRVSSVVQTASGRAVVLAGFAISMAPVYLVTWRVARRFGAAGLTVCLGLAAIVGPPRDYALAARFPNWIVFSPGMAPMLAVAVTYALWIALGHATMRLVAGAAHGDDLRGQP